MPAANLTRVLILDSQLERGRELTHRLADMAIDAYEAIDPAHAMTACQTYAFDVMVLDANLTTPDLVRRLKDEGDNRLRIALLVSEPHSGLPTPAVDDVIVGPTLTPTGLRVIARLCELRKLERETERQEVALQELMHAHDLPVRSMEISLAAFLEDSIGQRRELIERRALRVEQEVPFSCRISADVELLSRVIANLLDNAARYTPVGGVIRISLSEEHGGQVLRIGNSGPAIPKDRRERVFEKIVHPSSTARMNLGLYFCRLAIERQGGRLWYEETAALPSVFAISFPLPRSQKQKVVA